MKIFEIKGDNIIIKPFNFGHLPGLELPVNKETNEKFPNCCPLHKQMLNYLKSWYEVFPECCSDCRDNMKRIKLKKEDYPDLHKSVLIKILYVEHCISEKLNEPDYFHLITSFIEVQEMGFGHPPFGLKEFHDCLKSYLKYWIDKKKPELNFEKLQEILNHLEKPIEVNKNDTDLPVLIATIDKWLELFPFEIQYFVELKSKFKHFNLIIKKDSIIHNPFIGIAKLKFYSQKELLEILNQKTMELLSQVDSVTLIKIDLIADYNKHSLELILKRHTIRQKRLFGNFEKGELKYLGLIDKWLKNEAKLFIELRPLIKQQSKPIEKTEPQTLLDIWLPDSQGIKDTVYQKFIEYLKQEYKEIESPFVTETNGKLYWNKIPLKGWVQYLAGFIYTCIQKKWIADQYSAPQYKAILEKTFNTDFNPKAFKQISVTPPKEQYLKPFKNLQTNI